MYLTFVGLTCIIFGDYKNSVFPSKYVLLSRFHDLAMFLLHFIATLFCYSLFSKGVWKVDEVKDVGLVVDVGVDKYRNQGKKRAWRPSNNMNQGPK